MNTNNINWAKVPETLSLEQVRKLLHVSKRTAKTLLDTEIPCVRLAKTTHKYLVNKQDLIEYLGTHPGTDYRYLLSVDRTCNSRLFTSTIPRNLKMRMAFYLRSEFKEYPDLLKIKDIAGMIGYGKEQIGEWANEGVLPYITVSNVRYVTKSNLIDFLCTEECDSIYRKSQWHKEHIEIFKEWK